MSSISMRGRVSLAAACACAMALTGAQAFGQKVIANIPVPGYVGGGAVDAQAHRVYIPAGNNNGASAVVEVINENSDRIASTILLPTSWPATSAALNPKTGVLWVGTETGGLFAVDTKTEKVVGFVNVDAGGVALNPSTNTVYVSDFNDTLSVIDGNTGNIVFTNSNLGGIQNLAVDPFANRVYIAMQLYNPGAVWVMDGKTNQIIAKAPAGSSFTFGVAVDPFHGAFYSADEGMGTGTATIYNSQTDTQSAAISIAGEPAGVAVDPATRTLYVSDSQNNDLNIINAATSTLTGTLPVGPEPAYLTDDPVNKRLFVGTETVQNGSPYFWITIVKTN